MSVLIKGMKTPKDYKYVDVRIFCDGTATTSTAEEPFYKKMDVVELPKHGRLIDADALKEKKKHSNEFAENVVSVAEIDWMPTIIEEEGE